MTCHKMCSASACVVSISGEVDLTCASELTTLEKELAEPDSIVFDVTGLEYADTTFLRFLLRLRAHGNKSRRTAIRLVGVGRRLQRLFEVTGLSHLFAYEVTR